MKYIILSVFSICIALNAFSQTISPLRTKEKALELITDIHARIVNNQLDFCAAALAYSDDVSTSKNCGDISWVSRGMLIPTCENELFKLPINGISKPFLTEFGYMIFQLVEKDGELCHARFIHIKFEDKK